MAEYLVEYLVEYLCRISESLRVAVLKCAATSKGTMFYEGINYTRQFLVDLLVSLCFLVRQGKLCLTG